jgi:sporulation protein YlmC with PRC-barrel domain
VREVVATQSSDELLASKLKGTAVMGSDDQKIGDISDVPFDKMGHVKAYIVSVGGWSGFAEASNGKSRTQCNDVGVQESTLVDSRQGSTPDGGNATFWFRLRRGWRALAYSVMGLSNARIAEFILYQLVHPSF